jgi:hypothetical protein
VSLIVALGGFEGPLFTHLHLYAAPLDIVVGLPTRGNEKELNATFKRGLCEILDADFRERPF